MSPDRPPTPTPCLSVDPRSLRKGALSPPLSCLTLEDAPLWTWLPSSLKKRVQNICFQIVGGGGARARPLGFKPQPCLFSLCDFERVAEPRVSSLVQGSPGGGDIPQRLSYGCGPKNPVRVCRTPARPSSVLGTWRRLEGKPRTPLSSRVATRVSWSPLSGLKGINIIQAEAGAGVILYDRTAPLAETA